MPLFWVFCLLAAVPRFRGPLPVLCAGVPIDVGTYGIPDMADWDGDGRKDLIVGQFDDGSIRCYLNTGSDSSPVFESFFFITQANGSRIKLPFG